MNYYKYWIYSKKQQFSEVKTNKNNSNSDNNKTTTRATPKATAAGKDVGDYKQGKEPEISEFEQ